MTILCGTDFTPAAAEAVRVASLWCRAVREELLLAHALGESEPALREKLAEQLAQEARGIGARVALGGTPIEAELVRIARENQASLVVLGALGRRAGGPWRLGSTADRVAQLCHAPLLVVRAARPLQEWLEGKRKLEVAVAYDPSPTGDAALRWAAGLARVAPVELVVLHSYGIAEQRAQRGIGGPLSIGKADARIEEPLAAELRARIGELALVLRGGLGRPAEPLVEMAEAAGAQLLVVGNHHKRGLERAWKGSVSRALIELANCSVACISVPEPG